jgi:hypothetical protein
MEGLTLEANLESRSAQALRALEDQRRELVERGKSLAESSVAKIRRALAASTIAGLSLLGVGCGATEIPHSDSQTPHQADRFDRAEQKLDEQSAEHQRVKQLVESYGLKINDGDQVHYDTVRGEIVRIYINNQKAWENTKIVPESVLKTEPPVDSNKTNQPELKVNPETKDFS